MSRPEEAHLVEIFWSAQGEGLFVGASTVFIRFGGCDLRCSWCDSPETWRVGSECRIETEAGSQAFASLPNPVSLNAIVESIVDNYGKSEVLTRMSDPNWFQALGAVMGMHWNSSGVTATVLGALKRRINPKAHG